MKRGERVPRPYTAQGLLDGMVEAGFLLFLGPGEHLFVLPHDELGPRLREWIHDYWDGLMAILQEEGGVVGHCPTCGGRVFWRVHRAALACLDCADGVPADVPEKWYLTEEPA